MSYATGDDIRKWIDETEIIQLTDDNNLGIVDEGILESSLEAATVEIDGYLGGRYTLPLAPVPPILGKICTDIALFNLYGRRGGPPDHWQTRYNNAVKFLDQVARGGITLGTGDPEGTGPGDTFAVDAPEREFSRDTLSTF